MSQDPGRANDASRADNEPTPVVGIGASAGGVDALSALFEALPTDTGLAFAVVLHLDRAHASFLTEILSSKTRMTVAPAEDGAPIEPNRVYVITPNTSLAVADGHMRVETRSEASAVHLPVDVLFNSLADVLGNRSIGVLLSGSGSDGSLGMEAIKAKGGITFAQDEASARFHGMPGSAIAAGCVDYVLAPRDIAAELARIARHPYLDDQRLEPSADEWNRVFRLLRSTYSVDFASYKRSTIHRRLLRRLALRRLDSVAQYLDVLSRDASEVQALYQDFLIRVTSFFRDPDTFVALANEVFPAIRDASPQKKALRIWVPGCATGEEVYSIAIALFEFLGDAADSAEIQIFGTDVNPLAIERARIGRYVENIALDVSPERLRRFFVKVDDRYEVAKRIRDVCIFAVQNVARDPPFSRLDVVSCRNVLIYLEAPLQKRVAQVFHYALLPHGYLVLGPSETIGQGSDLFELVNQRQKIYRRVGLGTRLPLDLIEAGRLPSVQPHGRRYDEPTPGDADRVAKEADQLLITRFAPASLLIDEQLNVVHFRGHVAPYLEQQPGSASLHLSKLVHPALLVELTAALDEARKHGAARRERVRVASNDAVGRADIEVVALKADGSKPQYLLALLRPHGERASSPARRPTPGLLERLFARRDSAQRATDDAARERDELRQEVESMRLYLNSIVEANEAAQEELRSANEEVLSANEEFQSTNEELETAKEELQSANEELATTNEELSRRNEELAQVNDVLRRARDYSQAIVETVRMPLLLLSGAELRVRAANRAYREHFNANEDAIRERPLAELDHGAWKDPTLRAALADVMAGQGELRGFRVQTMLAPLGERTLVIDARRLVADITSQPDLLLVSIDDVTEAERAQRTTRQQAHLLNQSHDAILVWELAGPIRYWNRGAEELYGFSADDAVGKAPDALLRTRRAIAYEALEAALVKDGRWAGEQEQMTRDGRRIVVDAVYTLTRPENDAPLVLETTRDITERKRAEATLREQDQRKDEFLAMLGHELRNPLAPIVNALELLRATSDAPEVARLHDVIARQIGALSRIVDDLLDVARVTRGYIELRRDVVDLCAVIGDAVESMKPVFDAHRQSVLTTFPDAPLGAVVDAARVEQAVVNLLSNASRYSPDGSQVDVELAGERMHAVIRVRDHGIGISPDDLPRIFQPFVQVARGPYRGGLGIGLTLVKRIVDLHGGSIEARSGGLGEGTEFVVRLPLGAVDAATQTPAPTLAPAAIVAPERARERRVLVVDDNADSRESIAALLESWGCMAAQAGDGAGAVAAAATFAPDVVLLDIGLPDIDGHEVAQRIRNLPGLGNVIIVAVTGWGTERDRQQSRAAGIDRHMVKPLDLRALARLLERLPETER